MIEPKIVRLPLGDRSPEAKLYYGGDVRASLRALPEASAHCVVTSPPYWGLRDYGTPPTVWGGDPACNHQWSENRVYKDSPTRLGGEGIGFHDAETTKAQRWTTNHTCGCGAWRGQLGLEPTPDMFAAHMVEVFREVRRVLRPDGTVWLNLGDSYVGGGRAGRNPEYHARHTMFGQTSDAEEFGKFGLPQPVPEGLKPKDLAMVPFRVAFALQADGWWLRSVMPWVKRNCMPESCTDRPTVATEYWFLLSQSESYFYDIDAVRKASTHEHRAKDTPGTRAQQPASAVRHGRDSSGGVGYHEGGRNRRTSDWWVDSVIEAINETERYLAHLKQVRDEGLLSSPEGEPLGIRTATVPYKGAHFAVFPPLLIEPMILASTSAEGCCPTCGAPWERIVSRERLSRDTTVERSERDGGLTAEQGFERTGMSHFKVAEFLAKNPPVTVGWQPTCECGSNDRVRAVVLDPFSGSATTGMVSLRNGRDYIGLDLNAEYLPLAEARILATEPPAKSRPQVEEGSALDLFGGDEP